MTLVDPRGSAVFDVAPKENLKDPWLSGVTTQSTTDMPATTYIVVGSAGNQEDHEPFTREPPERVALRLNEYGYGRMLVHNATHLSWQFLITDGSQSPPKYDVMPLIATDELPCMQVLIAERPPARYDVIGDNVTYVMHHHGPFAQRRAERASK